MDGYRLKEFRKSLKMTQKELSEKTGLSLDQVKKLETGRNRLTSDKFREIKMRLGLINNNSENPLRMMIDYLRMTFKNIRDIEYFVETILFISYTNFVSVASGLYGYNSSLRFGNIWILYYYDAEARGNYNLTLQLSGQGCREMELYFENTGLTWQSWLERSMVFHEDANITRIDIALDDLYKGYGNGSKHFQIPSIIEKMNSGLIKTKQFRSWEHVGGGIINNENFDGPDDKGVSVYFGSRQSSLYFNFYEKRFELAKKEKITVEESLEIFGIWNRYEVRYSHDTAQALVMKFIEGYDLGDMVRGLINQRLSVYQGIDEKWGSYIPDEKWQRLFGNVDYLKLTTQAEPYDIMRTVRWLYYQVSNSLALVKEYDRIVNRNFLEDILESGEITEVMEKRLENVRTQYAMLEELELKKQFNPTILMD